MALTHTRSLVYILDVLIFQHFLCPSLSRLLSLFSLSRLLSLFLSVSFALSFSLTLCVASMASMASEHCFFCKAEIAEFITGWPLKDGSFAKLCGKCGYAYIHDQFCETFHAKSDGWRHCDGCKKRLHCGCIMSCHTYTELDYGGVGCSKCLLRSKKSMESAANEGTYLTTLSDSDTHSVVSNEIIAECCSPGSSKGKASALIGENSNVDSSGHTGCEQGVESETPRVDASTQNHLYPQNLLKMTSHEQLQKISGKFPQIFFVS